MQWNEKSGGKYSLEIMDNGITSGLALAELDVRANLLVIERKPKMQVVCFGVTIKTAFATNQNIDMY